MLEKDVPQEGNATLGGQRKAVYAVGEDGRLHLVASRGWEAEEIVTRQAVEDLERRALEARRRALAGQASPLEYHMYKARMDLALLSQTTGLWQWRIRRHFRPEVFSGLSGTIKQRYSEALGITPERLEEIGA